MLSDNDTFEEMVAWARFKLPWLRRFLRLENGIPSEAPFIRVFRTLGPKQFEQPFGAWTNGILPALDNETLAIPALLESLYLKGLLVSIDAMGCQRDIITRDRQLRIFA